MSRKEQTNVADPGQLDEAKKRDKLDDQKWNDALKYIFADPRGRHFYWKLMGSTGLFRTSFTGSSETFFKEGSRNVGLKLLADLNLVDPEVYVTMIREERNE